MNNNHTYTIEIVRVETVNIIRKEAVEVINQKISEYATYTRIGKNENEVFKRFASQLEAVFRARISTFTEPSNVFDYYVLNLPLHGSFDASPAKFSVSFRIKRNFFGNNYGVYQRASASGPNLYRFQKGYRKARLPITFLKCKQRTNKLPTYRLCV